MPQISFVDCHWHWFRELRIFADTACMKKKKKNGRAVVRDGDFILGQSQEIRKTGFFQQKIVAVAAESDLLHVFHVFATCTIHTYAETTSIVKKTVKSKFPKNAFLLVRALLNFNTTEKARRTTAGNFL